MHTTYYISLKSVISKRELKGLIWSVSCISSNLIGSGNHAIGTVRKFPTLPLNSNGVWIDPTGGVWRQANATGNAANNKEHIADYTHISGGSSKMPTTSSNAGTAAASSTATMTATTGVAAASGHGDYERYIAIDK